MLLLIPFALGAADFLCGWRKVVVRNDFWVPVALIGALALCGIPILTAVAIAASFALWRAFGWAYLFGGEMYPRTGKKLVATFARHLLIAPIALVTAWWVPLAFAAWATLLARFNHDDINSRIEFARCAGLGVFILGAL